ncbi:MAG: mechanosensitive ion channel domain-containing protein [Candidatus Woesearchaeota archaeon]
MPALQDLSEFVNPVTSKIVLNPWVKDVTIALLILLIGFILGRVVGRLVKHTLGALHVDKNLQHVLHISISLERFISGTVTFVIFALTIVLALNQIRIAQAVVNGVAIALIVVVLLSLFLALKDFFPNLMGGIVIRTRKYFKEGNTLVMQDITGIVKEIKITDVVLETSNGDRIIVPNAAFLKSSFWKKKSTHGN